MPGDSTHTAKRPFAPGVVPAQGAFFPEAVMKSLRSSVWLLFRSLYRRIYGPPSLDAAKRLCLELIDDVNPDRRNDLSRSILRARRREDVWALRSAVFGSVSLAYGELEARQRVARLDALLS